MSTVVRTLKAKNVWYFSRFKGKKRVGADVITSETAKNNKNNVFRSKQTTKKVAPNIFRRLEVTGKVWLMFQRPEDTMKWKCYVFSAYKQRNKVRLFSLVSKLQDDGYG